MYCGFIWIHFFHVHKSLQKCRLFISSGFIEKKLKRKTKCCPVLQSPEVWSYWLRWVLKQTAEVWKNKAKLGWLYLDQSDWCLLGYDPELPVLQGLGSNVLPELLPHVVKALPGDGNTGGWKLQLARTARRDGWKKTTTLKRVISRPSLP